MNDSNRDSNGVPGSPENGSLTGTNPDRLDGWKEIAAYLRRAPRTAQRWEAQFGLPVHRIGGEVVYALRSEIDAWAASEAGSPTRAPANGNGQDEDEKDGNGQAAPQPGPDGQASRTRLSSQPPKPTGATAGSSRRFRWWIAGPTLAAAAAAILFLASTPAARPIHGWRSSSDELRALDDRGREIWMYRLPGQEQAPREGAGPELLDDQRRAMIEDLDGDGLRELIFITGGPDPKTSRLLVLNADGTLRFSRQRTGDVSFGGTVYHGPFAGAWVDVTTNADGSKALWYHSRHVPLFAGVIEKFDARGNLQAEYWNGGAISNLAVGVFGGRRLVLIGGDANEGHGATVAVFEEGRVGGGNVGGDAAHTCTSCGPVQAEAIFLFPRQEVGRIAESESKISQIAVKDEAEIQVDVEYYSAEVPGFAGLNHAVANFFFDAALNLEHAEHGAQYRLVHDFLWKRGRLDHAYGDQDRAEVRRVLRWTGGTAFEPVCPADAGPALVPGPQAAGATRPAPAAGGRPGAPPQ